MDRRLHTPISKEGRFRFGKKIEEESHLLLLHQKSTTHCLQQNTARSREGVRRNQNGFRKKQVYCWTNPDCTADIEGVRVNNL